MDRMDIVREERVRCEARSAYYMDKATDFAFVFIFLSLIGVVFAFVISLLQWIIDLCVGSMQNRFGWFLSQEAKAQREFDNLDPMSQVVKIAETSEHVHIHAADYKRFNEGAFKGTENLC